MESKSSSHSNHETWRYTGPVQWNELDAPLSQHMGAVMKPRFQASPVVLFIGAGASRPLGMPTMAEFPRDFADILSGSERHLWNTIVDFSADFNGVPLDSVNIEHVLTCIHKCQRSEQTVAQLDKKICESPEAELIYAKFQSLEQALNRMTTKVLDGICAKYGEPEKPSRVVECYSPLFDILAQHQISTNIFTTNYDLTFEVLAHEKRNDFELVDGFPTCGSRNINYNFVPNYPKGRHALVLWKMHGSTSWKGNLPKGPVRKDHSSVYGEGDSETIILPPTQDGIARRKLSVRPFTQMYGGLKSLFIRIGVVKVLLVVGYGFGDQEIVDVISEGFQAERTAKLIVVDPNACEDDLSSVLSIDQSRIILIREYFGEEHTHKAIKDAVSSVLS